MSNTLQASTQAAPAGTEAPPAAGIMGSPLPMLVIIGVMFYFLLIRPQQKQAKERKSMLGQMKVGDKVITVGGIHAVLNKINEDDTVILKVSDNTNMKLNRSAVDRIVQNPPASLPEPTPPTKA